ncbi:BadF/BadG/BcrA/BcrD ATPase family protein [Streptomyces sp. TRM49041]|uniref:N-acetylglucosamine kinase n=1 Tax=Streptomyces sp. TRM49041 TaxID=2603216 RepID=UPI0011EE3633|nr:BadF/BadG/BcrA/BcrD ATPase family protein [Streptomyces sp. TRM49041]
MTATRLWVLGVDSGGSGLRVALGRGARGGGAVETVATRAFEEPVPTGPAGIDAARLLKRLVPAAESLLAAAGAAGGAGAATLGAGAATLGAGADGNGPGRGLRDGRLGSPLSSEAVPRREAGTARSAPSPGDAGAVGGPPVLAAVAVGAAGMAGLGDELRAVVPGALRDALRVGRVALASDAVTAYAGALGQRPGTMVAAGTGVVALGTDLTCWRRADGWGHLLGDSGSGAWIGRAGLEAALRAHDGRRGGSPALLGRAEAVFGPVAGLPGLLYPRQDRAAVLASFAPEVARCAADDAVAAGILARAARHIAEAAAAVHPPGGAGDVALTGGLFRVGEPLLVPLRAELAEQLPGARPVPSAGDPLTGALAVAAALATGALALPREPGLLDTFGG